MEKVLKDDAVEDKGDPAMKASFSGAMKIAELVKATLGPKGMDKILQGPDRGRGRNVTVTNDEATILKSLHVDNPAAKVPDEVVTIGPNVEAKKKKRRGKKNGRGKKNES